jgi:hypothetical protein
VAAVRFLAVRGAEVGFLVVSVPDDELGSLLALLREPASGRGGLPDAPVRGPGCVRGPKGMAAE